MNPRVSVVIPTHNCSRWLPDCVDSVLDQSFDAVETIVIDDGSTDQTAQTLGPYLDSIRYVRQAKQGVSAARNRGIALARGDLIAFLDADDRFLPGKLAQQVACFDAWPRAGMINSGWNLVNSAGQVLETRRPWEDAPHLDLETWLMWKPVFPGALMVRTEWLRRVSGFDADLGHGEDVDLVVRLSHAGCRALWLREITAEYRQHDHNTSADTRAQAYGALRVVERFFSTADLDRGVLALEPAAIHHTAVWAAWLSYRQGFEADALVFLRKTFQSRLYRRETLAFQWLAEFAGHTTRASDDIVEVRSMLPLLLSAAELPKAHWPNVRDLMLWWLEVWRYYQRGDYHHALRSLDRYRDRSPAEIYALAQRGLLASPLSISARQVRAFWDHATRMGLFPASPPFEPGMLQLCCFANHIMGRRWRQALKCLGATLQFGTRPAPAHIWLRFFRHCYVRRFNNPGLSREPAPAPHDMEGESMTPSGHDHRRTKGSRGA